MGSGKVDTLSAASLLSGEGELKVGAGRQILVSGDLVSSVIAWRVVAGKITAVFVVGDRIEDGANKVGGRAVESSYVVSGVLVPQINVDIPSSSRAGYRRCQFENKLELSHVSNS